MLYLKCLEVLKDVLDHCLYLSCVARLELGVQETELVRKWVENIPVHLVALLERKKLYGSRN